LAKKKKTMQDYRNASKKRDKTARIIALILVGAMVIFAILSSVWFLF